MIYCCAIDKAEKVTNSKNTEIYAGFNKGDRFSKKKQYSLKREDEKALA